MKIPCEVVVWYILPTIRREVAKELVSSHGMSQAEVARKFGVTDAAISQYLKKKRGDSSTIERSQKYPDFIQAVKETAKGLAEGTTDFEHEMCRLCCVVKKIGILDEVYGEQVGGAAASCHRMEPVGD
jgi:hypothetical protein